MLNKYYAKPTHKKWRKIGDSLLYGCGAIGASGLFAFDEIKQIFDEHELKIIIGFVLVSGFLGKFISNFFKEEKEETTTNEPT